MDITKEEMKAKAEAAIIKIQQKVEPVIIPEVKDPEQEKQMAIMKIFDYIQECADQGNFEAEFSSPDSAPEYSKYVDQILSEKGFEFHRQNDFLYVSWKA